MGNEQLNDLEEFVQVLKQMLVSASMPALSDRLAAHEGMTEVYNYLKSMREVLQDCAQGKLTINIPLKGFYAGSLKALQANLNHLSWQVQRVAEGDFSQRVDFMGEFSTAFNKMVEQLRDTLNELRHQKERMQAIANDLRQEIAVRTKVEEELKKSQERYQELARTDALTGLYNRRYFFELAVNELERMKRTGGRCCIGMLDVDFFKKFNDTYGHVRGDKCLVYVAQKMCEQTRKIDLVGRYGGEEFIFLLPQTKLVSGILVANRMRKAISSNPVVMDDVKAGITVSMGITEIPEHTIDKGDLNDFLLTAINEADLALYEAKRTGRNKVLSYHELQSAQSSISDV